MRKPDDSTLTRAQLRRVRAEAQRALMAAGAVGRFPTPVSDIMKAAKLEEIPEDVLNEGFLATMRRTAGAALKRALSKVLGVFDARGRLVFVDRSIHVVKQTFIRLHETAHGFLPWQRDLYAVIEDCEQTLDHNTADLFDREANVFASEVLFQLNGFSVEANQHAFDMRVPLKLAKKYGASLYSAVRRYVSGSPHRCTVLVLDPPELVLDDGFRCNLRSVVTSSSFHQAFGDIAWPDHFTPGDVLGAMVPVGGRKMSGRRQIELRDLNGSRYACLAEAFTQGYQVFVLILAPETTQPAFSPPGRTAMPPS
jgi:hypothetical protein